MNVRRRVSELEVRAFAIGVEDSDRGAPTPDVADHHYGRRVEMDRSWTVYHVFTCTPAHIDGVAMTGLSRSDATDSMLSLNRVAVLRRRQRNARLRGRL
jgi:hypothetical protein